MNWLHGSCRLRKMGMRIGVILIIGILAVTAFYRIPSARASSLVADLSDHLIAITTGFSGASVLLFGATEEAGDIVVIVRGPSYPVLMHRKSRVAGIWINTASMTIENVPGFYAIASSRPLEEITGEPVRRRHQMGVEYLPIAPPPAKASPNIAEQWKSGLIRNQQRSGLFPQEIGQVSFLGRRLFRTRIVLPANVPTGTYLVEVFHLQDGRVVSAQTTPLSVSKIGVEAEIFDFAQNRAALYGVIAILVALVAGWLGHVVFRKG
ncbi:TIGR02186 family protein [Pelagibius sp. Alg239-R121]|uniref:TIGR02186 family protein n=1 Tax=Pelagibius sp. Alg239-R121 TaxID=2993448 RepID=UPI0024A79C95|nr:TIGR02186 family protein [Pelagibius sp. Alg239-R121]